MSRQPLYRALAPTNHEPVTCPAWMVRSANSMRHLLEDVSHEFFVSVRDILSNTATKDIVLARQVSYWVVRNGTNLTYGQVANRFGGRDHTTIVHGVQKIEAQRWNNPEFKRLTDRLLAGFVASRKAA